MQTLTVPLPDFVNLGTRELLLTLASRLYEQGELSLGRAAEVAGLSKRTFLELLGGSGVSVFNHDPSDLEQDWRNA